MRFALIRSPFVGSETWEPVEERLRDSVVARYEIAASPDWYDDVARQVSSQVDSRPWVAVLHSSAGSLAPALWVSASRLRGVIFVDAILPHPGQSIADRAPPAQIEALRRGSSGGLLARWDKWLGRGVLDEWLPDPAVRARLVGGLPRVPVGILDAASPDHSGWATLPAAYIQLSEGFRSFADRADALGWRVHRLDTHHLAMMTDAGRISELLSNAL